MCPFTCKNLRHVLGETLLGIKNLCLPRYDQNYPDILAFGRDALKLVRPLRIDAEECHHVPPAAI
jgi:hypothetical protein